MPRISQLPSLTSPDAADEIAIVDASAATTKKITRNDFLKGAALPADTVTTAAIADGAVTADKLDSAVTAGVFRIGATGNHSITSLNFQPKEVEFRTITTTDNMNTFSASVINNAQGWGIATADNAGAITGQFSLSGHTRTTGGTRVYNNHALSLIIMTSSEGEQVQIRGTVTAMTSNGFNYNVAESNANSGWVFWVARG